MTQWPPSPAPPRHPTSVGRWSPRREPSRALGPQVRQLLGIILFVVAAYYLTVWLWMVTTPKELSVPSVIGLGQQEALRILRGAGLQPEVVAEKPSETAPEDTVLASDPPGNRKVRVGRMVRLTVSTGSKWAKVPDVDDMSVDRARALIQEARLVVGKEKARYDKKTPIGYVMEQSPKAGERVLRGSEVALVVSRGPRPPVEVIGEGPPREEPRSTEISLVIPPGASLQEVRIVVQDRQGERAVYTGYHRPGETITQSVSGEGPSVVVRVYLSGILVQERSF